MTHSWRLLVAATLVAVLVGCGNAGSTGEGADSGRDAREPTPAAERVSAGVAGCPAGSEALRDARTVARADLDADGTAEQVRLTSGDSECPNALFAEVGNGHVWGSLPRATPPPRSAFGLRQAEGSDLVVTRQQHPRGGFQIRVFARAGERLVELERKSGGPLVPFVATDVQEHPLSVDCEEDNLVLTEAVAHEPAGVMQAWDVRRTTYAVAGTKVSVAGTRELADNVPPGRLEKDHPELVGHAMFESCRRR